jgi:hypothetical protein
MTIIAFAFILNSTACDARHLSSLQARYQTAKHAGAAASLRPLWREALVCGTPGTAHYSRYEMLAAKSLLELAAEGDDPERNRAFARHLFLNIANDKGAEDGIRREARQQLGIPASAHYD